MSTIDEIHRANLALLVTEYDGVGALAEHIGKLPSQVSQWLNASPDSRTGNPRGMRPVSCRAIEEKCGKPTGWMDVYHVSPEQELIHSEIVDSAMAEERRLLPHGRRATDSVLVTNNEGEIEIPQYIDFGGSMGAGLLLRDQPGEIHGWRVTPEWISKNVKSHTGAANLRIVTGFGDSMRPLYNPGDPLLVDAGVRAVDFDSIYFFRIGDEGFIKRLQRVPGQGLIAISENKSYRDWVITADMDFEVFARVIKVWCGSDF